MVFAAVLLLTAGLSYLAYEHYLGYSISENKSYSAEAAEFYLVTCFVCGFFGLSLLAASSIISILGRKPVQKAADPKD